jgi:hypothetical protein
VAGLFRPESDFDDGITEEPTPSDPNITGVLRAFYLTSEEFSPICDFINPNYSAADRKAWRAEIRGLEANIKSEGRKTLPDRRARETEDKAAGQCQGDLGDSVDS